MHEGEIIHRRLLQLGMTKTNFARRLGCSSQNVYEIFKTKKVRKHRDKIQEILNFDISQNKDYRVMYFEILESYNSLLESIKQVSSRDIIGTR